MIQVKIREWVWLVAMVGTVVVATVGVMDREVQEQEESKAATKFLSATECQGPDGVYRWLAKVDESLPPKDVELVTIKEMADWSDLEVDKDSPRQGKEKTFVRFRGKLVKVLLENDKDIHLQFKEDGTDLQVVAEVPCGKPWDDIRKKVFSLVEVKFPCGPHEVKLDQYPTLELVGMPLCDLEHAAKGVNNRRSYDKKILVWEVCHPVMSLKEIKRPLTRKECVRMFALLLTLTLGGPIDDKPIKMPVDVPGKPAPAAKPKPADKGLPAGTGKRVYRSTDVRPGDPVLSDQHRFRSGSSGRFRSHNAVSFRSRRSGGGILRHRRHRG